MTIGCQQIFDFFDRKKRDTTSLFFVMILMFFIIIGILYVILNILYVILNKKNLNKS